MTAFTSGWSLKIILPVGLNKQLLPQYLESWCFRSRHTLCFQHRAPPLQRHMLQSAHTSGKSYTKNLSPHLPPTSCCLCIWRKAFWEKNRLHMHMCVYPHETAKPQAAVGDFGAIAPSRPIILNKYSPPTRLMLRSFMLLYLFVLFEDLIPAIFHFVYPSRSSNGILTADLG